jgi:hypothetical protein
MIMSSSLEKDERRKTKARLPSSTSQAERKREIDRKSQRNVRERNRAYIAQLEKENEALLNLSKQAGHAQLTEQLRDQAAENERLRSSMREIGAIAMSFASAEMPISVQAPGSRRPADPRVGLPEQNATATSKNSARSSDLLRTFPSMYSADLKPMLACGDGARDYFGAANDAIMFMEAACMGLPCPDPDEDEDIILCAVFHGWNAASAKHVLDAGWQVLQLFDEGLFFRAGTVERVVTMRILRAMSLVSKLRQSLKA